MKGIKAEEIHEILTRSFSSPPSLAIAEEDKSQFATLIFAMQAYLSRMPAEERRLASQFGLSDLLDSPQLAALLTKFQGASPHAALRNGSLFWNLYHSTASLIRLTDVIRAELVNPKEDLHDPHEGLLVLEILDYENSGIPMARLASVAEALTRLYVSVDQALGDQSDPRVAFIDSGSNISIGLKGLRDTIDAVGNLFGRAWNALRYRKNDDLERNLDSAVKGLNVLEIISQHRSAGTIDAATADQLGASIKQQLQDLVGAGVMIENTELSENFDRRAVLTAARNRRLIGPGEDPPRSTQ